MNNSEWQSLNSAIMNKLINRTEISLPELKESHKGAFLALSKLNGEIFAESRIMKDELVDIVETAKLLCDDILSKNLNAEEVKKSSIQMCVVKGVSHIKNPLDWDIGKDGVCFQWGNRYQATYMPYETDRMDGDKIRIMDRLCSSKAGTISSLWRLPEALVWVIKVDSYK